MKLNYMLFFAFIGLLVLTQYTYAQKITMHDIPLKWEDFQSKRAPRSSHTAAHIAYGLGFGYSASEVSPNQYVVTFDTKLTLLRNKSWLNATTFKRLDTDARSRLLDHEKGHLIIGLIYHKKLSQALEKKQYTGNIKRKTDKIFNKVNNRMDRYNKKYDKKTKHSTDLPNQRQWNKKLLDQLNDAYSYTELKQAHF